MRLATLVACLPLAAQAEVTLPSLYGTWAATRAACTTESTWVLSDTGLVSDGDGGRTCGYLLAKGEGLTLDLLCPIPGETMQAAARRITLLANGTDRLTVAEGDERLALRRCPAGA